MIVLVTHYSGVKVVKFICLSDTIQVKGFYLYVGRSVNRAYETRHAQTAFISCLASALFKDHRIYHIIYFAGLRLCYEHSSEYTYLRSGQTYAFCFAVLAIPGAVTIILLLFTRRKFPNPEKFEPEPEEHVPFRMRKSFVLYIAGISCFAFGFIDYSLVIMHVQNVYTGLAAGLAETSSLVTEGTLPLLYAGAMLVDAIAALVFGHLYDKIGVKALMISTLLSSVFAVFIFSIRSTASLLFGVALWGIGMGAQESILKAVVTSMVPKDCRATGYGVFECSFGVFWFLGSWIMGVLYDVSIPAMVAVSVAAQLAAVPLYLASDRRAKRENAALGSGRAD